MEENIAPTNKAHKLLLCLLGMWLGASVLLLFVVIGNFKMLKPQALRNAAQIYKEIPAGEPRKQALKYIASELNRHFFTVFGYTQLALAIFVLAIFVSAKITSKGNFISLFLLLGISLLFAFYITPTLVELGRKIDFMPRNPIPEPVRQFGALHGVSNVLEILKLILLSYLTVSLIRK